MHRRTALGVALRHYRKEKGWTQAELAEAVEGTEISIRTIQRLEGGIGGSASITLLWALSDALDTPIVELLQFASDQVDGRQQQLQSHPR